MGGTCAFIVQPGHETIFSCLISYDFAGKYCRVLWIMHFPILFLPIGTKEYANKQPKHNHYYLIVFRNKNICKNCEIKRRTSGNYSALGKLWSDYIRESFFCCRLPRLVPARIGILMNGAIRVRVCAPCDKVAFTCASYTHAHSFICCALIVSQ